MKVTTRVWKEVELDFDAVSAVFEEKLNDLCGGESAYLNGDQLEEWEDTGHGSGLTHKLGKATPVQKAAHALRKELRNERKERRKKR